MMFGRYVFGTTPVQSNAVASSDGQNNADILSVAADFIADSTEFDTGLLSFDDAKAAEPMPYDNDVVNGFINASIPDSLDSRKSLLRQYLSHDGHHFSDFTQSTTSHDNAPPVANGMERVIYSPPAQEPSDCATDYTSSALWDSLRVVDNVSPSDTKPNYTPPAPEPAQTPRKGKCSTSNIDLERKKRICFTAFENGWALFSQSFFDVDIYHRKDNYRIRFTEDDSGLITFTFHPKSSDDRFLMHSRVINVCADDECLWTTDPLTVWIILDLARELQYSGAKTLRDVSFQRMCDALSIDTDYYPKPQNRVRISTGQ